MRKHIDINCDLGEGFGFDEEIMPYISSCNIACGGHYGDENTIRETLILAKANNVKVGAHPSFPDRINFGREIMKIDPRELVESIESQINTFLEVCQSEEMAMSHIKLHGALYNLAAKYSEIAILMVEVFNKIDYPVKIYAPYNSILSEKANPLFDVCREAFIDRKYQSDLSLLNRSNPKALITDPVEAWQQLYEMIKHQQVTTTDGLKATIIADTYCIHGDNKKGLDILDFIFEQLHQRNFKVK